MPLEIKELHIRVSVQSGGEAGAPSNGESPPTENKGAPAGNQDEIIKACIEQVLDILKERKEA